MPGYRSGLGDLLRSISAETGDSHYICRRWQVEKTQAQLISSLAPQTVPGTFHPVDRHWTLRHAQPPDMEAETAALRRSIMRGAAGTQNQLDTRMDIVYTGVQ